MLNNIFNLCDTFLSVKVYLEPVLVHEYDNNGVLETTTLDEFDEKKIKISVEYSESPPNGLSCKHFIVKLKRLTAAEIAKHTIHDDKASDKACTSKKINSNNDVKLYNLRSKCVEIMDSNPTSSSTVQHAPAAGKRKNDTELEGNDSRSKKPKHANINDGILQLKTPSVLVAMGFISNEVVWGRIKGWPVWPAKIKRIEPKTYEVVWFNDYRTSKLSKNQIYKFHSNFAEFTKNAHSKIGLSTAIKEALMFIASKECRNS